jgi:cell division septation protein DedD
MPFKHQEASYRTRKGRRYVCFTDVLAAEHATLRDTAKEIVAELRQAGRAAFFESQDAGAFYRVFVAE